MPTLDELADRFREFGRVSTATRAPLYTRLSAGIADDGEVLRLLQHAPPTQQLPVLLFAAVHFLLLHEPTSPLAAHYRNLSPGAEPTSDPVALFRSFALDREAELLEVLTTRNTQTNEVGRCSQFLPAFGLLAREVGPLAHVDVGASAGLTLLLPRFEYEYAPGGVVHPHTPSAVALRCSAGGELPVPVPASMPSVTRSVGIDIAPIDVMDDDEVMWLEACVWPDQADRFQRLVSAIGMAREQPPPVVRGDAVTRVAAVVNDVRGDGHPVLTNSWVLNYLTHDQRVQYVAELDRLGNTHDLSWVIAEAPAETSGLPVPTTDPPEQITVVTLVRWRDGERTVQRLATAHPHGYWLKWERG